MLSKVILVPETEMAEEFRMVGINVVPPLLWNTPPKLVNGDTVRRVVTNMYPPKLVNGDTVRRVVTNMYPPKLVKGDC